MLHWLRRNRSSKIDVTQNNFFLYMRHRSSTIDFSAASDRIFAILGLLESSHQGESKYDVSFVISALVKNFLIQAGSSQLMRSTRIEYTSLGLTLTTLLDV